MDFREFSKKHLLKVIIALIIIQLGVIAYIQNYNHRPIAEADQASVIEGQTVKISPLSNDVDKEKSDLAISFVSTPLKGSVRQDGKNLFYTADYGFEGMDSLYYTITDGDKISKKAYITIHVGRNTEPIANGDNASVFVGGRTILHVLDNDTDTEGDSLFIHDITQPSFGQLEIEGNKLIYTAGHSQIGIDSCFYRISDGKNVSGQALVQIHVKSDNDPGYPWLSSDIGDAAIPGSFTFTKGSFKIDASGSDIWNNADGCHFAYQTVTGDCEIYAKVESLEGTHEWAKAGVMVRESLSSGSKTTFVCITTRNGITSHQRRGKNASMEGGESNPEIKAPYWVKLVRKGNTFSYFVSSNGNKWENIGNADIAMESNVYIGLAVTSHDNSTTAKAVFNNVRLRKL